MATNKIRDSKLIMPLFKLEYIKQIFTTHVVKAFPSRKHVMNGRHVSAEAATLLTEVSRSVVWDISTRVQQTVEPQLASHFGSLLTGIWLSHLSYTYVTEDDVMASLGDSVQLGLEAALGLTREHSYVTNKMQELIALEVANTVNQWLNMLPVKGSEVKVSLVQPKELVNLLAYALTLTAPKDSEPSHKQGSAQPENGCEANSILVLPELLNYKDQEVLRRDRAFIVLFFCGLINYIAAEAHTSVYNVDFDGMLASLGAKTVGQLTPTLPKNVNKFQIAVYKKLCMVFGHAKFLLWAISSKDSYFEDTLVRILKEQLQMQEKGNFVKKARRFFNEKTTFR